MSLLKNLIAGPRIRVEHRSRPVRRPVVEALEGRLVLTATLTPTAPIALSALTKADLATPPEARAYASNYQVVYHAGVYDTLGVQTTPDEDEVSFELLVILDNGGTRPPTGTVSAMGETARLLGGEVDMAFDFDIDVDPKDDPMNQFGPSMSFSVSYSGDAFNSAATWDIDQLLANAASTSSPNSGVVAAGNVSATPQTLVPLSTNGSGTMTSGTTTSSSASLLLPLPLTTFPTNRLNPNSLPTSGATAN